STVLAAGRGRPSTAPPPGQPRERSCGRATPVANPAVGDLSQFGGWSHTNHSPACGATGREAPRITRDGRGTLHTTVQQGAPGPARRDVARGRQNEPLRITIRCGGIPLTPRRETPREDGPPAARRRAPRAIAAARSAWSSS